MNSQDALRFLEYEAAWCRSKEEHEALCLLLPALARVLGLSTMGDGEAMAFRKELREEVKNLSEQKNCGALNTRR